MREYLLIFLVTARSPICSRSWPARPRCASAPSAQVRDRDVHEIPIPYFGGVAMLGGLLRGLPRGHPAAVPARVERPVVFDDARAVLVGGAVICLVGVLDDIFELDAVTKFAGEVLAAGVAGRQGVQFYWLPGQPTARRSPSSGSQAALLTHHPDRRHGQRGELRRRSRRSGGRRRRHRRGRVLRVRLPAGRRQQRRRCATTAALLTAALAGACLGFLPHNFFPARMFMGDSGSLLIGFMLACSAISLTGQFSTRRSTRASAAHASLLPALLPLILPFAILMVPFLDLVLAVVRRTRAGRSPFSPDKQHLHHRLLEIGHSHRRAVLRDVYVGVPGRVRRVLVSCSPAGSRWSRWRHPGGRGGAHVRPAGCSRHPGADVGSARLDGVLGPDFVAGRDFVTLLFTSAPSPAGFERGSRTIRDPSSTGRQAPGRPPYDDRTAAGCPHGAARTHGAVAVAGPPGRGRSGSRERGLWGPAR